MNPAQVFNTVPNFIDAKKPKPSFSSIISEGLIFTFPPAAGSMKFSPAVKSEGYRWKIPLEEDIVCPHFMLH